MSPVIAWRQMRMLVTERNPNDIDNRCQCRLSQQAAKYRCGKNGKSVKMLACAILLSVLCGLSFAQPSCKTYDFQMQPDFNITAFEGHWYVISSKRSGSVFWNAVTGETMNMQLHFTMLPFGRLEVMASEYKLCVSHWTQTSIRHILSNWISEYNRSLFFTIFRWLCLWLILHI